MLSAGSGSLRNMLVWQTKMVARLALSNLKTHSSVCLPERPSDSFTDFNSYEKMRILNYLNILIFDNYSKLFNDQRKHKKGEPPKYKIIRPNPMINPGLV